MGVILAVLSVIGLLVLFLYLRFPPDYANPKTVRVYNLMTLGVCALLCATWVLHIYSSWSGSINEKWWANVAVAGALGIEIVFLGFFFLLRNFWIFKPRQPGKF